MGYFLRWGRTEGAHGCRRRSEGGVDGARATRGEPTRIEGVWAWEDESGAVAVAGRATHLAVGALSHPVFWSRVEMSPRRQWWRSFPIDLDSFGRGRGMRNALSRRVSDGERVFLFLDGREIVRDGDSRFRSPTPQPRSRGRVCSVLFRGPPPRSLGECRVRGFGTSPYTLWRKRQPSRNKRRITR